MASTVMTGGIGVRFASPSGRWILLVSVLGSGLAGIDATVVNVALPAIGNSLKSDFAGLQWTITAYMLTLASFILLGGSLADRFGRRRVFIIGMVWFAAASLLCGLAPDISTLIAARTVQGIGAALLTPGSLAIIQASFAPEDRARAIGAWSGFSGVATAVGPFLGGWLVEHASWRWVFLINAPLTIVTVYLAMRHVPETRGNATAPHLDIAGAVLGVVALGGLTYALVEGPNQGVAAPLVLLGITFGVVGGVAFLVVEMRGRDPMLPLRIFRSRAFTAANLVTFTVYGGFGAVFFLLVIQLQVVSGFTPLAAGVSILPITVIMLALSSRSGALAQHIGPRLQMSLGPAVCAAGVLLMLRISTDASYLRDVFPAVAVFGLGLAIMVAPLTATALAAAPAEHAGLASGVNNAVARAAGLIAIAVLPTLAGISGADYTVSSAFDVGFRRCVWMASAILAVGAAVAAVTIPNSVLAQQPTAGPDGAEKEVAPSSSHMNCSVGAPPLQAPQGPVTGAPRLTGPVPEQ